jgi:hypothetical protein
VRKLLEKESRFEVSAGGVVCGVRGTQFEIETLGRTSRLAPSRGRST